MVCQRPGSAGGAETDYTCKHAPKETPLPEVKQAGSPLALTHPSLTNADVYAAYATLAEPAPVATVQQAPAAAASLAATSPAATAVAPAPPVAPAAGAAAPATPTPTVAAQPNGAAHYSDLPSLEYDAETITLYVAPLPSAVVSKATPAAASSGPTVKDAAVAAKAPEVKAVKAAKKTVPSADQQPALWLEKDGGADTAGAQAAAPKTDPAKASSGQVPGLTSVEAERKKLKPEVNSGTANGAAVKAAQPAAVAPKAASKAGAEGPPPLRPEVREKAAVKDKEPVAGKQAARSEANEDGPPGLVPEIRAGVAKGNAAKGTQVTKADGPPQLKPEGKAVATQQQEADGPPALFVDDREKKAPELHAGDKKAVKAAALAAESEDKARRAAAKAAAKAEPAKSPTKASAAANAETGKSKTSKGKDDDDAPPPLREEKLTGLWQEAKATAAGGAQKKVVSEADAGMSGALYELYLREVEQGTVASFFATLLVADLKNVLNKRGQKVEGLFEKSDLVKVLLDSEPSRVVPRDVPSKTASAAEQAEEKQEDDDDEELPELKPAKGVVAGGKFVSSDVAGAPPAPVVAAAAAPGGAEAGQKLECSRCKVARPKDGFSKNQWSQKKHAVCRSCVVEAEEEAAKKRLELARKQKEEERAAEVKRMQEQEMERQREEKRKKEEDDRRRKAEAEEQARAAEEARKKAEEAKKQVTKECASCKKQLQQDSFTSKMWRTKERTCKACVALTEAKKKEERRKEEELAADRERLAAEQRKLRQQQEEKTRQEMLARMREEEEQKQAEVMRALAKQKEEMQRQRAAAEAKKEAERKEKEERRRRKAEAKAADARVAAEKQAAIDRAKAAEMAKTEELRAATRLKREEMQRKKEEEASRAREEAELKMQKRAREMQEKDRARRLREAEELAKKKPAVPVPEEAQPKVAVAQAPVAVAEAAAPVPAAVQQKVAGEVARQGAVTLQGDFAELYADNAGILEVQPLNPTARYVACKANEVLNMFNMPMGDVLDKCVRLNKLTEAEATNYKRILAAYGIDSGQDFLDVSEEAFKTEKDLYGFKGFHPKRIKEVIKDNEEVVRIPEAAMTVYMSKPLGRGAFSQVVEGDHGTRGRVAVKVLYEKEKHLVEQEVSLLKELADEHQNIISYYGHYFYTEKRMYFIVLSRCVLSMRDVIESKAYTIEQRHVVELVIGREVEIVKQVYEGMHYLHVKMDYAHRDLKPANVLLDETGTPKIIDFGIAKDLGFDALNNTTVGAGTDGWRLASQPLGMESDVFSLALLASYFLTNGSHPFGDTSGVRTVNLQRWERGDYKRLHLSDPLAEMLISQCVVVEPSKRLPIRMCIAHPLFWDNSARLAFLKAVWEQNQNSPNLKKPPKANWFGALPALFKEHFRGQFADTLEDQLRFVRVVTEHGMQKCSAISELIQFYSEEKGKKLRNGVGLKEIGDVLLSRDGFFPELLAAVYYKAASAKIAYTPK